MNWYLQAVLEKYADFSGRARRTEFWMFTLFNFLFLIAAAIIDKISGSNINSLFGDSTYIFPEHFPHYTHVGFIYVLYALAIIIPSLAIKVRRLHDVGKSGFFLLLVLIPVIGFIVLLVFMLMDSNFGFNKWGPNPKGFGID